jgi:hypothetical protein
MLFAEAPHASVSPPQRQHEWSIGIYGGDSPWRLGSPPGIHNPVLSHQDVCDVRAAFVADPFMLRAKGRWYMFFEVMNRQTHKGEIGLAISADGLTWAYQQIVLAEPFHLSYPYVFEWMQDYYMVPESYQAKSVRLYKASQFPTQWQFVRTLLNGPYLVDASLFQCRDAWWLFTETNPALTHDTLRLYYAHDLHGPWQEHPESPIIAGNAHIARPAGRVVRVGDGLIRYAQDCHPIYGTEVRAFAITDLTTKHYREHAIDEEPMLTGSGNGWNACGMHHVDPHRRDDGTWVACVDGFTWREP